MGRPKRVPAPLTASVSVHYPNLHSSSGYPNSAHHVSVSTFTIYRLSPLSISLICLGVFFHIGFSFVLNSWILIVNIIFSPPFLKIPIDKRYRTHHYCGFLDNGFPILSPLKTRGLVGLAYVHCIRIRLNLSTVLLHIKDRPDIQSIPHIGLPPLNYPLATG